jgi:large subunit ribosomal protein L22
MQARAVARYVRISPRKARQVADLVRGKSVDQALSILALTPRKASPILRKAILSAVANARHQQAEGESEAEHGDLFVREVRIDGGPMMKRIRPRAQGRAFAILKRMSHIKVMLDDGV